MTDLRALWVAALLACAAASGQAQPVSAAVSAETAKEPSKGPATTSAKDSVPAPSVDPEPPRRLKFKGRAANCLCADPITDEEIDAAAARLSKADTQTQTPRSKP
ncbi:MAG: hypothetical protein Q8M01_20915 [Rubrivivax sp.]|nr:hypothetical protein [Rubrivivax sp.]